MSLGLAAGGRGGALAFQPNAETNVYDGEYGFGEDVLGTTVGEGDAFVDGDGIVALLHFETKLLMDAAGARMMGDLVRGAEGADE